MDDINRDMNNKTKGQFKVMRGWGDWAGHGVNEERQKKKEEVMEKRKQQKIKELKNSRADAKLKGVKLETETRDKKFSQKYQVRELPHPFKSTGQFEALMKTPLGADWNTMESHKRLIQPEVLATAGKIIQPLKFKANLNKSTVDALVQHREGKKVKRPAAKF
jgi:U3 small nucleolar RNA-associated protein 14